MLSESSCTRVSSNKENLLLLSSFNSASGTLLLGMNTFCSLQCNTSEIETTRLFSPITWQNFHVPVDEFKPCMTEISRKTFPRPVNNRTFMYQSTSSTTNEVWTEEIFPTELDPVSYSSRNRKNRTKTDRIGTVNCVTKRTQLFHERALDMRW